MREGDLLAISTQACAFAPGGADPGLADRVALPAGSRTQLQAALAALTGDRSLPLDVVLADSAVKFFAVQPPQGLQRFEELRELAALRFEELFGTDSALWRISADWSTRRPFLCCAAPAELIEALEAVRGRRPMTIAPIFVRRFNDAAREFPRQVLWFVCRDGGWVTAACFEGSTCHYVRSTSLAARDSLARWLGQEALLANRTLSDVWLADTADEASAIEGASVRQIDTALLRDMRLMGVLNRLEAKA